MNKGLVLLAAALFWTCTLSAYSDKKVILLANSQSQKDTIGYNIVAELGRYAYQWIGSGEVILWDSPEKKFQISMSDLQAIERSNRTSFSNIENLFIYEVWTSSGPKTQCITKGLSFAGANKKGEEVLYGYIDYNSTLKVLLAEAKMKVNANAPFGITLLQAIANKAYDYDIIYFDKSPITDFNKNQKIKNNAFSEKRKLSGKKRIPEVRIVEYAVESYPTQSADRSAHICTVLEEFFNSNRQEFFNYGGDQILSYLKKSPIIISKFHVVEQWEKTREGITQTPVQVIPYVMGIPMNPIPIEQTENWNVKASDLTFTEELIKKDFTYSLYKINETRVQHNSTELKETLLFKDWNQLLPLAQKTKL